MRQFESTISVNLRIAQDCENKRNTGQMKGILVDCMGGGYVEVKRKGDVYPDCVAYNDKNFEDPLKHAIEKRQK